MLAYQFVNALLSLPDGVDIRVLDAVGQPQSPKLLRSGSTATIVPEKLNDRPHKDPLTLNAYQDYACGEAIYPEHGKGSVKSITIALSGIVGESGKAMQQWHDTLREGKPLSQETKDALGVACGHAFWYLAALSKELGLSLSDLGAQSIRQARTWRREQELADKQQPLVPHGRSAAAGAD